LKFENSVGVGQAAAKGLYHEKYPKKNTIGPFDNLIEDFFKAPVSGFELSKMLVMYEDFCCKVFDVDTSEISKSYS